MDISEALQDLRFKIHDKDVIEMTDDELITCLNEAIQYVASYLVGQNSPVMVKNIVIDTEEYTLPENFIKTAGMFPIKITGNKLKWLDYEPGESLTVRYFSTCPVVTVNDEMPFAHDALNQITIKLAAIYCGNQLESDIGQDKALLDEVNAMLAQTIGGVAK